MALVSVSSYMEPSQHLLFRCCEKTGNQLYLFIIFKRCYLKLQGYRHAVGCRHKRMSLQPSFTLPCTGSKTPDFFVLTFAKLIEGDDLSYSFFLRINVIFLSWAFSCLTGRKEMAGTECTRVKYSNRVMLER